MIILWGYYFTKFYEDMTKNVDFSSMANFWMCLVFFSSDFTYNALKGNLKILSILNFYELPFLSQLIYERVI